MIKNKIASIELFLKNCIGDRMFIVRPKRVR